MDSQAAVPGEGRGSEELVSLVSVSDDEGRLVLRVRDRDLGVPGVSDGVWGGKEELIHHDGKGDVPPKMGVSLRWFLKVFVQNVAVQELMVRGGSTLEVAFLVKKMMEPYKCSMGEFLQTRKNSLISALANRYIVHAWGNSFSSLLESLSTTLLEDQNGEDLFIWLDIFVINQHWVRKASFSDNFWRVGLHECIRDIGHTLIVLQPYHSPLSLKRSWCLWEIYCSIVEGIKIEVTIPPSERVSMLLQLRENPQQFLIDFSLIDLEHAQASVREDQEGILRQVRNLKGGITEMQESIVRHLRAWIIRTAISSVERIRKTRGDAELFHWLMQIGRLLRQAGQISESEPFFKEALELARNTQGGEDQASNVAAALENLAKVFRDQGKYDDAEPLLLESVQIDKNRHGAEHPIVAISLGNLAKLYQHQGKLAEAESLLVESLSLKRKFHGNMHPEVASSLGNLANLHRTQGKDDEAESLQQEALEIKKKCLGDNHIEVATSLANLASIKKAKGNHAEAESLYLECLRIRKKLLGNEHPDVTSIVKKLALLKRSHKGGRTSETTTSKKRQSGGESERNGFLEASAKRHMDEGNFVEAEQVCLEALELKKSKHKSENPQVINALTKLARVYQLQGKYDEAKPLFLESLSLEKKVRGDDHPFVGMKLVELGHFYQDQGDLVEADLCFLEALRIARKSEVPYFSVCKCLGNLARLRVDQKKYEEGESLLLEALLLSEKIVGLSHGRIRVGLRCTLARVLTGQNRLKEAEKEFLESLTFHVSSVSLDDILTVAEIQYYFAEFLHLQGRMEDFLIMATKAFEARLQKLGENHPLTIKSRKQLLLINKT